MIRSNFDLFARGAAAVAAAGFGFLCVALAGCAAGAIATTAAPLALTGTEMAVVARARATEPEDQDKEEDALKCEQLVRNPPDIEEVRKDKDLMLESREIRIGHTGEGARWVVYRTKGSSAEGWHRQSALDKLHFNPPLQTAIPDDKPRYLAYAISIAENLGDSERTISIAADFGPRSGSFEWQGKNYSYTLAKTLPCFPGPE